MLRPVVFNSDKGNQYLYSPHIGQISLIHPLLAFFYDTEDSGGDLNKLFQKVRSEGRFILSGTAEFTPGEFRYYLNKYRFLKRKGYFRDRKRLNFNGLLSSPDIKDNISRIKQLIFEVTEDCNLSCAYCAYSKFYINKERAARTPNLGEIRKTVTWFLSQRQDPEAQLTISFYGGEPLKNMKLIREVVSTLKSLPGNRVPFRFTMTSNGVYLKKYIDYLVEHDFEVGISLDGDDSGNRYRVQKNNLPSYPIVMRNLEFVRDHFPDFFEKNINFMSVMHNRNNYGTLENFFREKFGKTPLMSDISTLGINEEFKSEFYQTFMAEKKDDRDEREPMEKLLMKHPRVKEVADVMEKYSGIVFKNHYYMIRPKLSISSRKKFIPTATCTPFSMRAFVTTEGKILPCEHISREFEIGWVNEQQIHADPDEIAGIFNKYYTKIRTFCNKCYLVDNCKECMFNAGVENEQPSCEFFMGRKKFGEYLARHYSIIESDYAFFLTIADHAFRKKGS